MAKKFPDVAVPPCRAACGTRTSTRRTPAATSATSTRRTTSTASPPACRPSPTSSASSPPSRSPSVLQNINSFALGARKTNPKATVQVIFTGDWSLPVREAEADQCARRRRLRRHHLPRRQPEGGDRDRRGARRQDLRPQRLAGPAGAQGLHHRRRVQVGDDLQGLTPTKLAKGETLPNFIVGGYDEDMVQNTPFGAGASEARARPPRPRRSPS